MSVRGVLDADRHEHRQRARGDCDKQTVHDSLFCGSPPGSKPGRARIAVPPRNAARLANGSPRSSHPNLKPEHIAHRCTSVRVLSFPTSHARRACSSLRKRTDHSGQAVRRAEQPHPARDRNQPGASALMVNARPCRQDCKSHHSKPSAMRGLVEPSHPMAREEAREIRRACAALRRETAKLRAEVEKTRAELRELQREVSAGWPERMQLHRPRER